MGTKAGTLEIELITNVAKLQKEMREIRAAIKGATDDVGNALGHANDNLAKFGSAAGKAGESSKLAGHHVQNLAYQINDMVVGLYSGQKPMTVFMQQGAQIGQIMAAAGIGVKGLTVALLDMAKKAALVVVSNPYLLAAAAAIGTAAGAFKLFQAEVAKSGELEKYVKTLGLTADQMKKMEDVGITFTDVLKGIWRTIDDGLGLSDVFSSIKEWAVDAFKTMLEWGKVAAAGIYAAEAGLFNAVRVLWRSMPGIVAEYSIDAANLFITVVEGQVNRAIGLINSLAEGANKALAAAGIDMRVGTIDSIKIGRLNNPFEGAGQAAADAFASGFRDAYKQAMGGMNAEQAAVIDNIMGATKDRLKDQAQALKEAAKEHEKSAKAARDHAKATDELAAAVERATIAITNTKAVGGPWTTGAADVAAEAEAARQRNTNRAESAKAMAEAEKEVADKYYRDLTDAANAFASIVGGSLGNTINKIVSIIQSAATLINSLNAMSGNSAGMGGIGGMFDSVAKMFGSGSGGFSGILNGGSIGSLSQGLSVAGIGAGIGAISDKILGAIGIKSSGAGSMAGGAIGMVVGGPLGALAGAVIGGIIGGALKKVKKGISTIGLDNGALDILSTTGNSGSRKEASISSANSIIDSLNSIASQLGGIANGTISTSIGMRNKKYVVDTTGQGHTKGAGVLSFKTEEEAVKAALADAIKDGAITGLRAGTQALLQKGGDIEAQLAKAMKFESVFKELNPLGASISELKAKFAELDGIFKEAGASAEDFAKLQQLQARQLQDILDQAGSAYRSTFYTDAENLAFAKKTISSVLSPLGYGSVDTVAEYRKLVDGLDLTTEAGQTLYSTLMDLTDEFGVLQAASDAQAQQAAAVASQKLALEVQLLTLQGKGIQAVAKAREAELAALDPSLRALQKQVYLASDIADARNVLADAYQRESTGLEATITKFSAFSDSLKDFRATLSAAPGGTTYRQAMVKLMTTGALAGAGDPAALGNLEEVSKSFLQVSKDNAGSLLQYQRDVATVARYVDSGIAAAADQVDTAQEQLDALKASVTGLIDLNENVISVHDAIVSLQALLAQQTAAATNPASPTSPAAQAARDKQQTRIENILADLHAAAQQGTLSQNKIAKYFGDWDRNGSMSVTVEAA